jgi:hypothetical protein
MDTEPQPRFFTLFNLLVAIAAVTPIVGVIAEARDLGIAGTIVDLCFAAGLCVAQVVGHYWVAERLHRYLKIDSWFAVAAILAYYLAIVIIGGVCMVVTMKGAQQVSAWMSGAT